LQQTAGARGTTRRLRAWRQTPAFMGGAVATLLGECGILPTSPHGCTLCLHAVSQGRPTVTMQLPTMSEPLVTPGLRVHCATAAIAAAACLWLAGCAQTPTTAPGARDGAASGAAPAARTEPRRVAPSAASASAPAGAASTAPTPLATEQRWLSQWFDGTPVRITGQSDGRGLLLAVPLGFRVRRPVTAPQAGAAGRARQGRPKPQAPTGHPAAHRCAGARRTGAVGPSPPARPGRCVSPRGSFGPDRWRGSAAAPEPGAAHAASRPVSSGSRRERGR
jgi:hypothetical protein